MITSSKVHSDTYFAKACGGAGGGGADGTTDSTTWDGTTDSTTWGGTTDSTTMGWGGTTDSTTMGWDGTTDSTTDGGYSGGYGGDDGGCYYFFFPDVDYEGNDVAEKSAATAAACQAHCQVLHPNGHGWFHIFVWQACLLAVEPPSPFAGR